MKRLTKPSKIEELLIYKKHNVHMTKNDYKELKLGQLEDFEEELGIDLITLFKALKNGIYAYDHANNIDHMKILNIFYDAKSIECQTDFDGDIFEYDFEDYGEAWALEKEELL